MSHGRTLPLLLLVVIPLSCDSPVPPPVTTEPPPLATQFDEHSCGTITGTVVWTGDQPQVPSYLAPFSPLGDQIGGDKRTWMNPNRPIVDAKTKGVKDAVVYLRAVDPAKSRKWDHPAVRIEFRDDDLFVVQGDYVGRRGFVHRGDEFNVFSKQVAFQSLQARGAAFFNLTLPDVETTRSRHLDHVGIVELSSGVGRFWMRGHLFVCEHPYYARTDAEGRFTLTHVPAGKYQLVCWHPNWQEEVREHDADTYYICRLTFRPAAEPIQEIEVRPDVTCQVKFALDEKHFVR